MTGDILEHGKRENRPLKVMDESLKRFPYQEQSVTWGCVRREYVHRLGCGVSICRNKYTGLLYKLCMCVCVEGEGECKCSSRMPFTREYLIQKIGEWEMQMQSLLLLLFLLLRQNALLLFSAAAARARH